MKEILAVFVLLFLVLIIVAGYLKPYLELKKTGITFTGKEYFSKFIRKDILPNKHNKEIFKLTHLISLNSLKISLSELHNIEQSGGDLSEYVNAHIIVKQKELIISKTDIKTLTLSNKNILHILENKKTGEKISAIAELLK